MRKSESVPTNFHSCLCKSKANVDDSGDTYGTLLIKATPTAVKAMKVRFKVSARKLKVQFMQQHHSQLHTFDLCGLDYHDLAVGWFAGQYDMFVLAAVHDGRLHHEIYCYPIDLPRNTWLAVFEAKHVISLSLVYGDPRLVARVGAREAYKHPIETVHEVLE